MSREQWLANIRHEKYLLAKRAEKIMARTTISDKCKSECMDELSDVERELDECLARIRQLPVDECSEGK